MNGTPGVTLERFDDILLVTLDRPKVNAINAATSRALYEAFALLEADRDLRVGVVTGSGHRFFSAGWDLKAAQAGESHDADHGPGGFAGLTEYFGRTKPVIAAVNGSALGGGVELILAADLVVASDEARFSFPEARLGILPDAGGMSRVPQMLPRARALELLITGREFTASDAHEWGLINRVVPVGAVVSSAMDLAREVTRSAPRSVEALLCAVSTVQGLGDREAFDALRAAPVIAGIAKTADAAEGVEAFAKRRPPRWIGA